jgi:PH domain
MGCSHCNEQKIDANEDNISVKHSEETKMEEHEPVIIKSIESEMPTTDPNEILIQGELQKIQNGAKANSIPRWVQVTNKEIRYYKNEYTACFWWDKPLDKICIEDITIVYSKDNPKKFQILSGNSNKATKKKYSSRRPRSLLNTPDGIVFYSDNPKEIKKWVGVINSLIKPLL